MLCKAADCGKLGRARFNGYCCFRCAMADRKGNVCTAHGEWCIDPTSEWVQSPGLTNHVLTKRPEELELEVVNLNTKLNKFKWIIFASLSGLSLVTIASLKR